MLRGNGEEGGQGESGGRGRRLVLLVFRDGCSAAVLVEKNLDLTSWWFSDCLDQAVNDGDWVQLRCSIAKLNGIGRRRCALTAGNFPGCGRAADVVGPTLCPRCRRDERHRLGRLQIEQSRGRQLKEPRRVGRGS